MTNEAKRAVFALIALAMFAGNALSILTDSNGNVAVFAQGVLEQKRNSKSGKNTKSQKDGSKTEFQNGWGSVETKTEGKSANNQEWQGNDVNLDALASKKKKETTKSGKVLYVDDDKCDDAEVQTTSLSFPRLQAEAKIHSQVKVQEVKKVKVEPTEVFVQHTQGEIRVTPGSILTKGPQVDVEQGKASISEGKVTSSAPVLSNANPEVSFTGAKVNLVAPTATLGNFDSKLVAPEISYPSKPTITMKDGEMKILPVEAKVTPGEVTVSNSEFQVIEPKVSISEGLINLVTPKVEVDPTCTRISRPSVIVGSGSINIPKPQFNLVFAPMKISSGQAIASKPVATYKNGRVKISNVGFKVSQPKATLKSPKFGFKKPEFKVHTKPLKVKQPKIVLPKMNFNIKQPRITRLKSNPVQIEQPEVQIEIPEIYFQDPEITADDVQFKLEMEQPEVENGDALITEASATNTDTEVNFTAPQISIGDLDTWVKPGSLTPEFTQPNIQNASIKLTPGSAAVTAPNVKISGGKANLKAPTISATKPSVFIPDGKIAGASIPLGIKNVGADTIITQPNLTNPRFIIEGAKAVIVVKDVQGNTFPIDYNKPQVNIKQPNAFLKKPIIKIRKGRIHNKAPKIKVEGGDVTSTNGAIYATGPRINVRDNVHAEATVRDNSGYKENGGEVYYGENHSRGRVDTLAKVEIAKENNSQWIEVPKEQKKVEEAARTGSRTTIFVGDTA